MFDHVDIRVSDRAASERFYDTVLATIGARKTHSDAEFVEWDDFSIVKGEPVTRSLHLGFSAPSRAHVDEFWNAGRAVGYDDAGAPGPRPQYLPDYYGGFLLDPDGNSIEAVHHANVRRDRKIDHVWLRVHDVPESKRFYETAGCRLNTDTPQRVSFVGDSGALSLSQAHPPDLSVNVHVAFPAASNDAVDAFHERMVAAGYRDNGPPGERPAYHLGYYGAFVLDPDGNNVELVCHNRG